jgi:hypothetical protein
MRKLNTIQKEKIMKAYNRVGYIIVQNVEKYGNEKDTLENDIMLAYDIMLEKAS